LERKSRFLHFASYQEIANAIARIGERNEDRQWANITYCGGEDGPPSWVHDAAYDSAKFWILDFQKRESVELTDEQRQAVEDLYSWRIEAHWSPESVLEKRLDDIFDPINAEAQQPLDRYEVMDYRRFLRVNGTWSVDQNIEEGSNRSWRTGEEIPLIYAPGEAISWDKGTKQRSLDPADGYESGVWFRLRRPFLLAYDRSYGSLEGQQLSRLDITDVVNVARRLHENTGRRRFMAVDDYWDQRMDQPSDEELLAAILEQGSLVPASDEDDKV
jgi:hypothetical protein